MPSQCVYLLLCADGTLYAGWTNRLAARVAAHNAGRGAKYTKPRRPVRLVYCEHLPDKPAALRRECALKAMTRAEKLALIACGGCLAGLDPAKAEEACCTGTNEAFHCMMRPSAAAECPEPLATAQNDGAND